MFVPGQWGSPRLQMRSKRVGWEEPEVSSAGFTTGLAKLGLMEIEARGAPEKPSELRERLEAISEYMVERGAAIPDGDTLGESASEKIKVSHGPSSFGAKGTVMALSFDRLRKRAWWRLGRG